LEPGLGASRCSKVLGLPKMAGRLREMAEFTTDGWLESRESRSVAVVGA